MITVSKKTHNKDKLNDESKLILKIVYFLEGVTKQQTELVIRSIRNLRKYVNISSMYSQLVAIFSGILLGLVITNVAKSIYLSLAMIVVSFLLIYYFLSKQRKLEKFLENAEKELNEKLEKNIDSLNKEISKL
jgi:predicted PurR-regulated permease PerM